jgi:hypothetical protein
MFNRIFLEANDCPLHATYASLPSRNLDTPAKDTLLEYRLREQEALCLYRYSSITAISTQIQLIFGYLQIINIQSLKKRKRQKFMG